MPPSDAFHALRRVKLADPRAEPVVPNGATIEGCGEQGRKSIEAEVVGLYEAHAAGLFAYAQNLSTDRELSRDAVQETFLRYHVVRTRGEVIRDPRPWLFRVLRNFMVDQARDHTSKETTSLEAALALPDQRQDVETTYRNREIFQRAMEVL